MPNLDTTYDAVAVAAHPDDLEAVMAGTAIKLVRAGLRVLFVDLSAGEPARHARPGERRAQAFRAAEILGVDRVILEFQDRFIRDDDETRLAVADVIRRTRPRLVFSTQGSGVHPDHGAITEIVRNAVFYARLPKWGQIEGGEALAGSEPHEIERLFFGHCRMEPAWTDFDFAVDVSDVYDQKLAALEAYEAVFSGAQANLLQRYGTEDRYVGGLVDVRYAEAFKARGPLLVESPTVFGAVRFG